MTNTIDSSLYLSEKRATTTGAKTLGKDEFLKILMVQLQNQDPMKPMEDKEFISQMANFSSLEQMTNMSSLLEKYLSKNPYDSLVKYSELIGKQVEWNTENGTVNKGIVKSVSQNGQEFILELQDGKTISSNVITKVSQQSETV
ncbi:flagellar hook assembly protein FlgD [Litchfieldia salsa]|uniref:Flagellar basal-body rod modification protein FlgD n=1 Tax=Litchfieldia salsa TaxID=930152 RepID=A0A1H0R772_9BACI|nr:flagellar hook assembly protein FlgD [Litchfieldia salsa]SDP25334.1 flagellar basal-body rod modification protein FlgD [Litchfieldia salsa]